MTIQDEETMQAFIEESVEHLADIETDLLAIEKAGKNVDDDLINKVFRAAHSVKGGAGFMGLSNIRELSHKMENILGMIRSKKITPTSEIINVLLMGSDALKNLVSNVKDSDKIDVSEQIETLQSLGDSLIPTENLSEKKIAGPHPLENSKNNKLKVKSKSTPARKKKQKIKKTKAESEDKADRKKIEEPKKPSLSESNSSIGKNSKNSHKKGSSPDSSIRVHLNLLDSLMNLAGELVLGRNQLLQSIISDDHHTIEMAIQKIDLITSELQEKIMLTRMQPIGNVFSKFPRLVRDLAKDLGKQVELAVEGRDVELDKTIIELIGDPLTHLIRNSIDHGIESPEERHRLNKESIGKIYLRAYHEAGQVNIEVIDDGKGLNGNKIASAAIEKGILTDDQAISMSENEKVRLIFLPGFSMAEKVSDISGRGVGMDVVKTNLDRLGGQIDIETQPGSGSTIRIKLPLTLAIIPSQIIRLEGERYAIPQLNLEELLRIPAEQVSSRIEKVGDAEVVRLRGKLLPLVSLSQILGIQKTYIDPSSGEIKSDRRKTFIDRRSDNVPFQKSDSSFQEESDSVLEFEEGKTHYGLQNKFHQPKGTLTDRRFRASSALNIAVVSTGPTKYGLVVDELCDSEEIVVKPLGRHLNECKGYLGATLMGDGRVALILDVGNLARMSGLNSSSDKKECVEVLNEDPKFAKKREDLHSLLLFRSAIDEQFAVPLNLVERIEKVKRDAIEDIGGKNIIQYRGGSLPLFAIDQVARVKPLAEGEDVLAIIFKVAGKEAGLMCIGPIDAVDVSLKIDKNILKQPGIMGSVNIGKHTTQLVDIMEIARILSPNWFSGEESEPIQSGRAHTVLYAEDSAFFRDQVKVFLEEAGYNVLEAEDGILALDLLENRINDISLVLTDLEMPNLDGFELTRRIKTDKRFSHLPVIALTTLTADIELKKGKEVGIDEYQIKLDREKLIKSISTHLNS
jgi:two-component system chemotaxis sensor kinase CheA